MVAESQTKQLFKILIGAAWVDGKIQKEEREYLHKMAQEKALNEDPEIRLLLSEAKPVEPEKCYQWLETYLGEHPDPEDYEKLLESLSGIIYSDNDVHAEEAKLLNYVQNLEHNMESHNSLLDKVLQNIRQLYSQAVKQQGNGN